MAEQTTDLIQTITLERLGELLQRFGYRAELVTAEAQKTTFLRSATAGMAFDIRPGNRLLGDTAAFADFSLRFSRSRVANCRGRLLTTGTTSAASAASISTRAFSCSTWMFQSAVVFAPIIYPRSSPFGISFFRASSPICGRNCRASPQTAVPAFPRSTTAPAVAV